MLFIKQINELRFPNVRFLLCRVRNLLATVRILLAYVRELLGGSIGSNLHQSLDGNDQIVLFFDAESGPEAPIVRKLL